MSIKKVGLLGFKLSHSISDVIHNNWITNLNIANAVYLKLELPKDELPKIKQLLCDDFIGFNVTIPYKQDVIGLVDKLTEEAKLIKAVNTIYIENDQIIGDNSDCIGFINALIKYYPQLNLSNCKALVIGAGGAARAVIYSLLQHSVTEILIKNRSIERAVNLINDFNDKRIKIITDYQEIQSVNLVINCTSIGMLNNSDLETPFDFKYVNILDKDTIFYDLIYNPKKTIFLTKAENLGYKTLNGLPMLVLQADYGFKKWFKQNPLINDNLYNLLNEKIV